ncbi:MAG: hypothetical protein PHV06_12060, partial [bacterium]|nr:hypothetical protein [bacterium]
MKTSRWLFVVVAAILLFSIITINAGYEEGTEGIDLVKKFWADMKTCNTDSIDEYMSPEFQSIHEDGSRNKEEQLELIKNLKLGEYTLSNFKVTE